MNSSIRHIDGTLTSITIPGQSGPESNGAEGVLHIPPKLQYENRDDKWDISLFSFTKGYNQFQTIPKIWHICAKITAVEF